MQRSEERAPRYHGLRLGLALAKDLYRVPLPHWGGRKTLVRGAHATALPSFELCR